jgi:hypothetical protein
MSYKGTLTKAQRGRVLDLHRTGLSARKIAQEVDLPYGRVRRYLEHLGSIHTINEWGVSLAPTTRLWPTTLVWDIETTNLRSDIGALIVVAFLNLGTGEEEVRTIYDFKGSRAEREKQLVEWASERYASADILIGHNSQAFDKNFMNGVRARHGLEHLPPRFHIDTYQVARNGFKGLLQSYSMENLADFFRLPIQKDKPSKHDWRQANLLDEESVSRIATRCVEDVRVNALLWEKMRPYWQRWKGV